MNRAAKAPKAQEWWVVESRRKYHTFAVVRRKPKVADELVRGPFASIEDAVEFRMCCRQARDDWRKEKAVSVRAVKQIRGISPAPAYKAYHAGLLKSAERRVKDFPGFEMPKDLSAEGA